MEQESKGNLISKITDSWLYGTPTITTPIGAEGLFLETLIEEVTDLKTENNIKVLDNE